MVSLSLSACRPLAVTTCLSWLHRALGVIIADSLERLLRRSPSVLPWLKLVLFKTHMENFCFLTSHSVRESPTWLKCSRKVVGNFRFPSAKVKGT